MVFGLLDVVLIVILASAFVVARSINQNSKQKFVQEAIPLKSAVQDLALQMVNEETGSRGYVITGNRAALQPLTAGRERVPDDLQVIADTVPAEPTLGAELARAREEIATLDRYYDTQIALVSGPRRAARRRNARPAWQSSLRRVSRDRRTDARRGRSCRGRRAAGAEQSLSDAPNPAARVRRGRTDGRDRPDLAHPEAHARPHARAGVRACGRRAAAPA